MCAAHLRRRPPNRARPNALQSDPATFSGDVCMHEANECKNESTNAKITVSFLANLVQTASLQIRSEQTYRNGAGGGKSSPEVASKQISAPIRDQQIPPPPGSLLQAPPQKFSRAVPLPSVGRSPPPRAGRLDGGRRSPRRGLGHPTRRGRGDFDAARETQSPPPPPERNSWTPSLRAGPAACGPGREKAQAGWGGWICRFPDSSL